ncbi:hypothetical protein EK0264_19025 [Epidermidibacterium keratini]|uniref:Uncharacterized protein n=1 Tax=Epidermidibacterium keratini TaxID=1891644 RepID=A0A7L4YSK4_9ACTN|nr:hypothetical protein [Epidermidibacterium keratini]QHC02156.1 hypothetical protein EK0264_19025 [Epidermidibacterium keratini]
MLGEVGRAVDEYDVRTLPRECSGDGESDRVAVADAAGTGDDRGPLSEAVSSLGHAGRPPV